MSILGIVILSIIMISAIAVLSILIITRNALIRMKNNIENSYLPMLVYLKKRLELLPELIKLVSKISKNTENLKQLYSQLSCFDKNRTRKDFFIQELKLSLEIQNIIEISKITPEWKDNFELVTILNIFEELEDNITNSRHYYNGLVKIYNNTLNEFPSRLFKKWLNLTEKEMFINNN